MTDYIFLCMISATTSLNLYDELGYPNAVRDETEGVSGFVYLFCVAQMHGSSRKALSILRLSQVRAPL